MLHHELLVLRVLGLRQRCGQTDAAPLGERDERADEHNAALELTSTARELAEVGEAEDDPARITDAVEEAKGLLLRVALALPVVVVVAPVVTRIVRAPATA